MVFYYRRIATNEKKEGNDWCYASNNSLLAYFLSLQAIEFISDDVIKICFRIYTLGPYHPQIDLLFVIQNILRLRTLTTLEHPGLNVHTSVNISVKFSAFSLAWVVVGVFCLGISNTYSAHPND